MIEFRMPALGAEMEAGTLLKMGAVYGFAAACVCGIVADRQTAEEPNLIAKASAVDSAIKVAILAARSWTQNIFENSL